MVICSRTTDLKDTKSLLNLRGEIVVKSPTQAEINIFLCAAGDDFLKFLDLETTNEPHTDSPITPFLLATIYQAYRITQLNRKLNSLESINNEAIRLYVNAMLCDHKTTTEYSNTNTMNWLKYLAQQLTQNNQSLFYLERIQPNYLPQGLCQIATLVPMMISGLMFGIVFGWGFQIVFEESYGLITGGLFGLTASLLFWMFGIGREIQPVEILSWSRVNIQNNAVDRVLGTLLLIVIFILFGAIFGNIEFGVIMGLFVSIGFFLFYELPERKLEKIKKANEGFKRAVIHCLCTGLFAALIMTLILNFLFDSNMAIPMVSAFGLFLALLNGGHFCIQHLVLRIILWYKNYTPWNFISFLNFSVKCSVMYKIGGGYKFRHGLFMDYFAELDSTE